MAEPKTGELAADTPFDKLSLQDVKDFIPKDEDDVLVENRAFVEGNHWQDGDGWIGPRFDDDAGNVADSDEDGGNMELIEEGFTSRNATAESCERHDDAVTGLPPDWNFAVRRRVTADAPITPTEQELIDEVVTAFRDWWDERDIDDVLSQFVIVLLWAARSAMRIVIPRGIADEAGANEDDELPNAETLADALALLFPERLEPESATVHRDADTFRQIGVALVGEKESEAAELYFLDADNEVTVWQTLSKDGVDDEVEMLLGGRLPMIEVTRPEFVTEQVREQQRALNLAMSMIPRNATTGGFLERLLLNAQPPGEWSDPDVNGKKHWLPGVYRVGAGTTNFVAGLPVQVTMPDGTKKVELTNPSAVFRDPVPVTPAIEAADAHYKAILSETDQLHVLIAGDAVAAGISRQHARADFIASVRKTGKRVNRVGRWLLETTLAMAEFLMGEPGKYTDTLRATFAVTYDYGPLSADERRQNNEDVKSGTMARPTAMVRNNITDTQAETAAIDSQPDQIAARETAIATAVQGWVSAGADFEGACARLGLTPEMIEVLRPDFEDDGDPNETDVTDDATITDDVTGGGDGGGNEDDVRIEPRNEPTSVGAAGA